MSNPKHPDDPQDTQEFLLKPIDVEEFRARARDAVRADLDPSDLARGRSDLPEEGVFKNVFSCISMLDVLHDIAASTSETHDMKAVLGRFLDTLTEIVGARAAGVRLLTENDKLELVASIGMDDDIVERDRFLPSESCVCGRIGEQDTVMFLPNLNSCARSAGRSFFEEAGQDLALIVVPLRHQNKNLGIYNLFVNAALLDEFRIYQELFTSVGRFLGMAIEKARLDEETKRLSRMEERTRMANELHDSLAQTLVSLRYQVRVLDDNLQKSREEQAWEAIEKLENTLGEANAEMRELIAHFRAPLDTDGVVSGVERAVQRFKRHSEISIFFQNNWPKQRLPSEYELHIIRIVQEALANIAKHSHANTVRVLLQGKSNRNFRVLIEDDGVGLPVKAKKSGAGENIGLSIMKDRARSIGGRLVVDSEPGEGTRVVLLFSLPELVLPIQD
ncbi:MAG: histidine kinase [Thiotrichales bacterium]